MSQGEVAEATGISIDAAVRGLQELCQLGYARQERRRYKRTAEGERALRSLAQARRDALAAFVAGLSESQRRARRQRFAARVERALSAQAAAKHGGEH